MYVQLLGRVFCLVVTVSSAMDTTSTTPSSTSDDATTEDTTGRILSLPKLEKCKNSNYIKNSKIYYIYCENLKYSSSSISTRKHFSNFFQGPLTLP